MTADVLSVRWRYCSNDWANGGRRWTSPSQNAPSVNWGLLFTPIFRQQVQPTRPQHASVKVKTVFLNIDARARLLSALFISH